MNDLSFSANYYIFAHLMVCIYKVYKCKEKMFNFTQLLRCAIKRVCILESQQITHLEVCKITHLFQKTPLKACCVHLNIY